MEKKEILNRLNKTETKKFLAVLRNMEKGNKVGWIDGNAIAHYIISSYQRQTFNVMTSHLEEYAHETRELIRTYIQENYNLERNYYVNN